MKLFFITLLCLSIISLNGARRSGFKSSYSPKASFAGLGKKSNINDRIKTKPISGHFKPSNGYKFVNPYARSK